ncbi:hypothetical protein [Streptomyces hoynatensis]|uniref:Uncharacterized protein n=1 Tax=Streptomyces hoynatensis TaxID=1141874 RepID=A0A3A9ZCI8_9ACTN|nr:hypothetical protein [Streptomyces hoynatensis]RKN45046.1 hypothetical protein D7294_08115 [Streptomyces hoynatensis]
MSKAPTNASARVLVVGRSPGVLVDAVRILRGKGYSANATNQFDRVLDDYDATGIDILVFGGMVPADTKQHLREEIGRRNPHTTFLQGLAGIAGLIAAQVEEAATSSEPDHGRLAYDAAHRTVELTLNAPRHVSVHAWWVTSYTPPEPKSTSTEVLNARLDKGSHSVPVPERVPSEASFATVAVGPSVRVFTVGAMPKAITRMIPASPTDRRLPEVGHVTTHNDDR